MQAGAHYLDTANYEPPDHAQFEYHWQWAYHERFAAQGLMAVLGSGFDPGVTNIFTAYANKHFFDQMKRLDILDCNGGDHGQAFATNFNPEINIREVTAPARYWRKHKGEKGRWIESPALTHKQNFDFPEIGTHAMYLMYHEELESLSRHFPELQQIRFWMSFGDTYLTHLQVLQNIGMTSIKPIEFEGHQIIPLKFLKTLLPDPSTLGKTTTGKTCIGTIITGMRGAEEKTVYIYNLCDHEACFAETGGQAVSYTTGVPAMIGTVLMAQNIWNGKGVFNMEQLDPDPFMNMLNQHGLPWHVTELDKPLAF